MENVYRPEICLLKWKIYENRMNLTEQATSHVPALHLLSKQPSSRPLTRAPFPGAKRNPRSAAEWCTGGDRNRVLNDLFRKIGRYDH